MPNLPMHIYLASRVAERLDWDWINNNVGSLLLGPTAPDIRIMTKWPRERTHFAPLSSDDVGTGTRLMFDKHPELANYDEASAETKSFLVGYVSHLVADEAWISTIYRPNFDPPSGNCKVVGNEVEANLWDRALQLEMDREAHPEMKRLMKDGETLVDAEVGVAIEFLQEASLQEWREWVLRFLGWDLTWDRLKRALNRMYRDNDDVQQAVDRFLEAMPYSLERIYEKIPEERLDDYQQKVLEETISHAREYMGSI